MQYSTHIFVSRSLLVQIYEGYLWMIIVSLRPLYSPLEEASADPRLKLWSTSAK